MMSPNSSPKEASGLRLFDTFDAGQHCGTTVFSLDNEFVDRIDTMFGPTVSEGCVHMASVPLLLMRAFTTIVANRPAGNLHVGQTCELMELPRVGSLVAADVICLSKELKRERRVLAFDVTLVDQSTRKLLISGLTTIFWAA